MKDNIFTLEKQLLPESNTQINQNEIAKLCTYFGRGT
jgi:hypothetical protein